MAPKGVFARITNQLFKEIDWLTHSFIWDNIIFQVSMQIEYNYIFHYFHS